MENFHYQLVNGVGENIVRKILDEPGIVREKAGGSVNLEVGGNIFTFSGLFLRIYVGVRKQLTDIGARCTVGRRFKLNKVIRLLHAVLEKRRKLNVVLCNDRNLHSLLLALFERLRELLENIVVIPVNFFNELCILCLTLKNDLLCLFVIVVPDHCPEARAGAVNGKDNSRIEGSCNVSVCLFNIFYYIIR